MRADINITRHRTALTMRRGGAYLQDIAATLGISASRAQAICDRAEALDAADQLGIPSTLPGTFPWAQPKEQEP